MKINNVSLAHRPAFTADSDSDSTNTGKWIGSGLSLGCIATDITHKGGWKEFVKLHQQKIIEDAKKEFPTLKDVKKDAFETSWAKNQVHSSIFWSLATIAGCCIGIGALFDTIIDATKTNN